MLYDKISALVLWGEAKLGRWGFALLLALIMMIAAGIYVRPGTNYVGHGQSFEALSYDPFGAAGNVLGFRIMTPLIAHLVGLTGRPFIIVNLVLAFITIAFVYIYFRSRTEIPGDAFVAAASITFSGVILITIFYAGFCDALTYLAIFLMWWWRRRWYLFFPMLLVGLLNHESVAFLLPWLIYIKIRDASSIRRGIIEAVIGFCFVFILYWGYREWIVSRRPIGLSTENYFAPLGEDLLKWVKFAYLNYWIGWFGVFKALWVFPIAAAIHMWSHNRRATVFEMLLIFFCAAAQLLIAYDTTRMLTVGFMVIVIALIYLFETDAYRFRQWAPWVLLFNIIIPNVYTASSVLEQMHSTPQNLLKMLIEHKPWW